MTTTRYNSTDNLVLRCTSTFLLLIALVGKSHPFVTNQLAFTTTRHQQGWASATRTPTAAATTTTTSLKMGKEIIEIKTDEAPAPVGPYSQAIKVGTTLYCSGQLALDVTTGAFIEEKGDVQAETKQICKNLMAVLKAAEATPANVVRCTVFLADLGDFAAMNEIYSDFFEDNPVPPTRSCVQAGALPLGAKVEIDCIAEL